MFRVIMKPNRRYICGFAPPKNMRHLRRYRNTNADLECAICLEKIKVGEIQLDLGCVHQFCIKDLLKLGRKNISHCPMCRHDFVTYRATKKQVETKE